MKKCGSCGRFYISQKGEKMCKECKSIKEIAFEKIKNNKPLQDAVRRLSDR